MTATVRQQLVTSRLVTLTGVGGVGKTRLALHVAHELGTSGFPDGRWLIDLTSHRDEGLVFEAIATTLGLRSYSEDTTQDALISYLAERRTLLVLDNCEHLIDGAAYAIAALLDGAPELRVLATSREPLGIDGEHLVTVRPLAVPPAESEQHRPPNTSPYDAVRLLVARVEAMGKPDFGTTADPALVARLVRRLDGIPLAIVLAAGRLHSLTLEDVLEQLDDRFSVLTRGRRDAPDHHRTLRSCIEWSYDRCSPPQQALWQRLAVFAGHFSRTAVVSVCSDEMDDTIGGRNIVDLLDDLVRQSVVQHDGDSYRLLDMVREYGLTRQETEEHLRWQRRHAEYYREVALSCAAKRFSRNGEVVPVIHREMANMRAALDWNMDHSDGSQVLAFTVALTEAAAWFTAASLTEGRRYLTRAMKIPVTHRPGMGRVITAMHIVWYAVLQDDFAAADWVKRCKQEAQDLGPTATAFASMGEGLYLCFLEEDERSIGLLAAALDEFQRSGRPRYIYLSSLYLANAALKFNDLTTADAASRQCLEFTESQGDEYSLSWALLLRGLTELSHGHVKQARELLRKSLRTQRKIGAHWGLDWTVETLSWAAATDEQYTLAAQLMGAASRLQTISAQDKSAGFQSYFDSHIKDVVQIIRNNLTSDEYETAYSFGSDLTSDQAIAFALGDALADANTSTAHVISSPQLSRRETEVTARIVRGLTNREIGQELFISTRTVETHVKNILKKLGAKNRTDLALQFKDNFEP
ncbi:LuxR C-terminal-related transcriptional regulator [Actinophytocola sp.]|uniref:helix-turn-helix transcriptional regulator n=1 Tax=Actinophytocola sp. TaxID=1872138 RepID=UPI00389A8AB6